MKVKFLDIKAINDSFEPMLSCTIKKVFDSGWYVAGEFVKKFESEFADYIGTRYCVSVGNGLDALTLVLKAWKIKFGWQDDAEVILPANTFIATALAVTQANLRPVLCEPSAYDALIDTSVLDKYITSRTRAIIPVHLYGRSCNMEPIMSLADKYGLMVLEDACQSHGAYYHYSNGDVRRTGAIGHAAAFSFYPGKNLGAIGDGGCVTTDDKSVAEIIKSMANYGQKEKYVHVHNGVNSRLDEIQASVLSVKLKRLDEDNSRRREIAIRYYEGISNPNIEEFSRPIYGDSHVYHLFVIKTTRRDELKSYLEQCGIETLIHYPIPIHLQDAYSEMRHISLPVTENLQSKILSLPISSVMKDSEVDYVVRCLNDFR
jgi:dTDP-4-amino-4,6-dideoxygalactose transaminase